jgi:hypothetical protein
MDKTPRGMRARFPSLALLLFALALWAASAAQAAPAWLTPAELSAPGSNGITPVVRTDDRGDAIAVWDRSNGTNTIVQAASRTAGATWQPAVDLSASGQSAIEQVLAVDPAGDAVAAWVRSNGSNKIVEAALRSPSGAWGSAIALSAPGEDANEPEVAFDAKGDAIAVWDRSDGTNLIVQAALHPAGGSWQEPVNVSLPGRTAELPRVAMDAAGDAVAVWERFNGANIVIQSASLPAGGKWSEPERISEKGSEAGAPEVASDAAGDAFALFERSNGVNEIAEVAERPAGGSWQPAVPLSPPGRDGGEAHVAVDAGGDAAAIWQLAGGPHLIIEAATRAAGGAWGAPVELSAPEATGTSPHIALAGPADALAVWTLAEGGHKFVQGASGRAGGAWGAATGVGSPSSDANNPDVAVDARGDGVAVWQQSNGSNEIVHAAGYDASGPFLEGVSIPAGGTAGQPLAFSVSPLDAWSALGTTSWSFGDGTGATGTGVSHTYAAAGTYTVTLSSSDALGNASAGGGSVAVGPAVSAPGAGAAPAIAGAHQSNAVWREGAKLARLARKRHVPTGTTFSFTLSEAARVSIAFRQKTAGRLVDGHCVAQSHKNRHGRRCSRTVTKGSLVFSGHAGLDRVAFEGRISRSSRLAPGTYTAVITATNAAGQRSNSASLTFRIVR